MESYSHEEYLKSYSDVQPSKTVDIVVAIAVPNSSDLAQTLETKNGFEALSLFSTDMQEEIMLQYDAFVSKMIDTARQTGLYYLRRDKIINNEAENSSSEYIDFCIRGRLHSGIIRTVFSLKIVPDDDNDAEKTIDDQENNMK